MVDAYLEGTASEKQTNAVEQYYDLFSDQPDITEEQDERENTASRDRMKAKLDLRLNLPGKSIFNIRKKYLSFAAAILFVSALSIYLYQHGDRAKVTLDQKKMTADIAPGKNKATLTLSNGSKISLSDMDAGQVTNQPGMKITKTKDSGLVYTNLKDNKGAILFNTIEIPKGGQYQITLPDGTKVWLNASSSLRYPLTFPGQERKVELQGEAYFEVAKNKDKPFKVHTDQEVVQVLGTHFNVNAYTDELFTKTSLLEGSVKVTAAHSKAEVTIRPGQQSIISTHAQKFKIKNIDLDEAVAWKNGYFIFDDESLESVLRKISRWYDVDIEYQDIDPSKLSFSGTLSKYSNASKVLRKLELTGSVHFKIEGRKIVAGR